MTTDAATTDRGARDGTVNARNAACSATRLGCATAALLAGCAGTAHAQAAAPAPGPSLLPLVLTFAFVLALIPVAVWLLKRMGGAQAAGAAGLRVVAQLPLGQRERLVVVEAGERWLLLGVTAGAINRVGTLPKGELPVAPQRLPFASLLGQARRNRGDA